MRRNLRTPCARTSSRGFTLLELCVVVLIIGILATFAGLSLGNRVSEDKLQTEAQRAEAIVRLASEEAEAKGVDIGLLFHEGGYRLLVINNSRRWADYEREGPLRTRELEEPIRIAGLEVEGKPVTLPGPEEQALAEDGEGEDEPGAKGGAGGSRDSSTAPPVRSAAASARGGVQPQVLLLSSGEGTPFALDFAAPNVALRYRLVADGAGGLSLTRSGGKS